MTVSASAPGPTTPAPPAHRRRRGPVALALGADRRAWLACGLFSGAASLLLLVPSLFSMQVYDRVLTSRHGITLLALTAITLGLYALLAALDWARGETMVVAGLRLDERLRQRVFDAALRRPGASALSAQSAMADLGQLRQFLSGPAMHALFDLPWLPVMALAAALLHPWLGAYVVAASALLLGLVAWSEWRSAGPLARAAMEGQSAQQSLGEAARHTELVHALGLQATLRRRWGDRHLAMLGWQAHATQSAETLGAVTRWARMALQSMVFALGAWLAIDGQLSGGSIFAVSLIVGRALAPVEHVLALWRQLVQARAAWDRLDALLDAVPAPADRMSLPAPNGQLSVQHATAVAGGRVVLQGVSCQAMPGDVVGIIGPSGSGKSTLARLLLGIEPPIAGHARLDGADLSLWPREALGPHLGYLPQTVNLMEGSIAENIARFGELDPARIVVAAKAAGVHAMVLSLPQGYDTRLGPDGAGLSGGQKQRVALARALYGNPCLVVLDEPNAHLDADGEAALHAAIAGLKARGATVFVITQRQGALALADKLLVLQEGRAVAFGAKADVIQMLSSPPPASPASPTAPMSDGSVSAPGRAPAALPEEVAT